MIKVGESIVLKRDCAAVQIPSGQALELKAGTEVRVSQSLGGSVTVTYPGGMCRIEGRDWDALGAEPPSTSPNASSSPVDGPADEKAVWDALKNVYDPEIPVNIVDLGLVYSLELKPLESGAHKAEVKMTLTAPGCGMGPVIQEDAKNRCLSVPGVAEAEVELVWDPPWNQGMISEVGRMKLGMI